MPLRQYSIHYQNYELWETGSDKLIYIIVATRIHIYAVYSIYIHTYTFVLYYYYSLSTV